MTTAPDIWTLCSDTFGSIPAKWRPQLEAIERHFPPGLVAEAFGKAKEYHARDIGYVETVLLERAAKANGSGNEPDASALPEHVICVGGHSAWTNDCVVRRGQAVCSKCCESGAMIPMAPGTPHEERRSLTEHELASIPEERRGGAQREENVRTAAWRQAYDQLYDTFLREHDEELAEHYPQAYEELSRSGLFAALRALRKAMGDVPSASYQRWQKALRDLGPPPVVPTAEWRFRVVVYGDPVLTPAARIVAVYWRRIEGRAESARV